MTARIIAAVALLAGTGFACEARSQTAGRDPSRVHFELPAIAEVVNGHTELVTYRGVRALKLVPAPETAGKDEDMMALLDGPEFASSSMT
jgi:predicted ABC-type sugar transport system permease subunit